MDMIKTIKMTGNKTARNRRNTGSSQLHLRLELSFLNSYDMAMLKEKYSIRRIRDMIAIVNENMEEVDE